MRLAIFLVLLVFCACRGAHAQSPQQALVDRSALALEELLGPPSGKDWRDTLQHARAVLICPRIFRAGFLIAGSGGDCILIARGGAGTWSGPAFYAIGSGSIGFQAGIEDSEVVMLILTRRGLDAILDSQFKFGAEAGLTFATFGAGVEGATTAALRADIVAYSHTRGLFAGIALDGTILSNDTAWNQAYYGQPLAARQIVIDMQSNNPGADPLRSLLARYGAGDAITGGAPADASPSGEGYAPAQPAYAAPPAPSYDRSQQSPVAQEPLPPPHQ